MVKSLLCLAKSLLRVHVPSACAQIFQERPQIFMTLFWYHFPGFFSPPSKLPLIESCTWNTGCLEIIKSSARVFLKHCLC